jgi:hypothetical protein
LGAPLALQKETDVIKSVFSSASACAVNRLCTAMNVVPALGAIAGAVMMPIVSSASAETFSFSYVGRTEFMDPASTDGLVASGTIDVEGLTAHSVGTVVSGTGTITAPFLDGGAVETLTLLTFNTPGVTLVAGGIAFTFPFGGTQSIFGDTTYPLDTFGLLFSVSGPGTTGFNLGSSENGGDADQAVVQGANNNFNADVGNGVFTVVNDQTPPATPLPATLPLFAAGLSFLGCLTRRKKRMQAVAA